MAEKVGNSLAISEVDSYHDEDTSIMLELTVSQTVLASIWKFNPDTEEWEIIFDQEYDRKDIDEAYDVFKEMVIAHRDGKL